MKEVGIRFSLEKKESVRKINISTSLVEICQYSHSPLGGL
jgi:hypothetical protein